MQKLYQRSFTYLFSPSEGAGIPPKFAIMQSFREKHEAIMRGDRGRIFAIFPFGNRLPEASAIFRFLSAEKVSALRDVRFRPPFSPPLPIVASCPSLPPPTPHLFQPPTSTSATFIAVYSGRS